MVNSYETQGVEAFHDREIPGCPLIIEGAEQQQVTEWLEGIPQDLE